jgi:hypothetical protein
MRLLMAILILGRFGSTTVGSQEFTNWADTDDQRGIQFRYKVANPDFDGSSCYVEFRDLRPDTKKSSEGTKGDTDITYHWYAVSKNGKDSDNNGHTRIFAGLSPGNENISYCARISSIAVTDITRGL